MSLQTPTAKLGLRSEPTCVADYIMAWMMQREIVPACNGNFAVFLLVVVEIANQWSKHFGLDYMPKSERNPVIERRVTDFSGDQGTRHPIYDVRFFNKCGSDWQLRGRR